MLTKLKALSFLSSFGSRIFATDKNPPLLLEQVFWLLLIKHGFSGSFCRDRLSRLKSPPSAEQILVQGVGVNWHARHGMPYEPRYAL